MEGIFTNLRLLHNLSVLARTPHREKVEISLKNTGHGGVSYIARRVSFAGEARLDERDFPDGGGLEEVVRHPSMRVEEPDPRCIAGVLKRRQHLRGKCTRHGGTVSTGHVVIGVRPRALSSTRGVMGSGKVSLCAAAHWFVLDRPQGTSRSVRARHTLELTQVFFARYPRVSQFRR